jgi:hypothetical protein
VLGDNPSVREAPIAQVTIPNGAHSLVRYKGMEARRVQSRVSVLQMGEVLDRVSWPRGVYLFTSLDGMNAAQLGVARWLWNRLSSQPSCFACLNDPSRVFGRYRLLRLLHERGVNDFNVCLLSELDRVRFPAFVRYEHLHRANLTGLLHSRGELEDALALLLLRGERASELIVTEWLDYRSDDGLYRKWGAHIVGSSVIAKHVMVGTQWMMKMKYSKIRLAGAEEREYVVENPHVALLEPVFDLSGCDWGRVDYSIYRGRMQVWEVNDNPEFGKKWKHDLGRRGTHAVFYRRLEAALDQVSSAVEAGLEVEFTIPSDSLTPAR